MASTSTNKRPRTSSSSSSPKPRKAQYNVLFRKTDLSDITLESSDGCHFATSKIHLQSSSAVFRDTLLIGQDQASEQLDGLPLLKLEDNAFPLGLFLSFVQVEPTVVPSDYSLPTVLELDAALTICDKYHAPLVGRSIVSFAFPPILSIVEKSWYADRTSLDDSLIDYLALALIWSQYDSTFWVKKMIGLMGARGVKDKAVTSLMKAHTLDGLMGSGKQKGWRPFGIGDIQIDLLRRMAVEDISSLSSSIMKLLTEEEANWYDMSEGFLFSKGNISTDSSFLTSALPSSVICLFPSLLSPVCLCFLPSRPPLSPAKSTHRNSTNINRSCTSFQNFISRSSTFEPFSRDNEHPRFPDTEPINLHQSSRSCSIGSAQHIESQLTSSRSDASSPSSSSCSLYISFPSRSSHWTIHSYTHSLLYTSSPYFSQSYAHLSLSLSLSVSLSFAL
ncbi:hypothetical protein BDY24DRAFT_434290, partial [Mrakia frigida]|uniref:uncharacterized protein n=1 Tax=Mrakia frigida TaxID=29902 RepID=UPI003FCC205F